MSSQDLRECTTPTCQPNEIILTDGLCETCLENTVVDENQRTCINDPAIAITSTSMLENTECKESEGYK